MVVFLGLPTSYMKHLYVTMIDGHSITYVMDSWYLKQYPTKALAPFMLEDYRKVTMDQRGEEEQYSYEDILRCMKKGNL